MINDVSTNEDGTSKSSDIPVGFTTRTKDRTNGAKALHPCWGAYRICDEYVFLRAPAIYVNIFSWEAMGQVSLATLYNILQILADAMGLGKTVMTIALILARQGRGTLRIKNRLPKVRLIQKPYESGDYRGIMLIKAIWRPLKLYYLQTEVIIISFYVITVSFYFFNSL
ncbi:unnamed protein product [Coffea canephora]|uniref:Uncharacterized protein n=1 Tax=Coffea canephora TaxID=49390 RepID=A0A068U8M6_COFCA|nr:unnamed protein product [Coffea canephora]